jgi:hypothetical protein
VATLRGHAVDQPRKLTKSITVEWGALQRGAATVAGVEPPWWPG